jgi:hypothetical protein
MNVPAGPEGRARWPWGTRVAAALYVAWLLWLASAVIVHLMH